MCSLNQVIFDTSISKADLTRSLEFPITAKWSLRDIPVDLTGHVKKCLWTIAPPNCTRLTDSFTTAGSFLRDYIKSISMSDIRKLFSSMTGGDLDPVE
jgi:hypothetical protein